MTPSFVGASPTSYQGLPNAARNLTDSAAVMVEQVKTATGIDLPRMARNLEAQDASATLPKDLD